MDLEYIFLAKFADLSHDGLFTVHGGGLHKITLAGAQFPGAWPLLYLVARVRATPSELAAPRRATIERVDPAGGVEVLGEDTIAPSQHLDLMRGPDGRVSLNICIGMISPAFPAPGLYEYRVKLDGREIGATKVLVSASGQGDAGGKRQ